MLRKVYCPPCLGSSRSIYIRRHNWQAETLTSIETGKNYSGEHDIFRTVARNFWRNIDEKRVAKWYETGIADRDIWTEAGALGLRFKIID